MYAVQSVNQTCRTTRESRRVLVRKRRLVHALVFSSYLHSSHSLHSLGTRHTEALHAAEDSDASNDDVIQSTMTSSTTSAVLESAAAAAAAAEVDAVKCVCWPHARVSRRMDAFFVSPIQFMALDRYTSAQLTQRDRATAVCCAYVWKVYCAVVRSLF